MLHKLAIPSLFMVSGGFGVAGWRNWCLVSAQRKRFQSASCGLPARRRQCCWSKKGIGDVARLFKSLCPLFHQIIICWFYFIYLVIIMFDLSKNIFNLNYFWFSKKGVRKARWVLIFLNKHKNHIKFIVCVCACGKGSSVFCFQSFPFPFMLSHELKENCPVSFSIFRSFGEVNQHIFQSRNIKLPRKR